MKFFIVLAALVACAAARPQQQPQPIAIVRQSADISPEGSYNYGYETANGITFNESGVPRHVGEETPVVAQGSYAYTADDGSPISVSYTADENGFRAEGAHLPQPHPVPESIARALEYIAAHSSTTEKSSEGRFF